MIVDNHHKWCLSSFEKTIQAMTDQYSNQLTGNQSIWFPVLILTPLCQEKNSDDFSSEQ